MFFLHTPSSEFIKSKLDLFSLSPMRTSIESSQWIYYKLYYKLYYKRNFARGRFAHEICHTRTWRRLSRPHSHHVESSHTRRSKRGENTSVVSDGGTKLGPVNHLLPSMFNQIDVYFNQKLTSPNNAYAYRAYIEALLNYASPAKTSHLISCLWNADIPGYMDDTLDLDSSNPNTTFEIRTQYIQGNHALDLIGHLHCDVFNEDKFLINGVKVKMRLVRSKDLFCLTESKTISKIRILDSSLLVRRAKISPSVLLAR